MSLSQSSQSNSFDYIVIGSGFGGAVSAMRLSEKGYKVAVIEQGKRWSSADFPKTNHNLRKYLWLPKIGWKGIQKLSLLNKVFVLSGVGFGGGSLVYANTLFYPPSTFFETGHWSTLAKWEKLLAPYYSKARFMLGAVKNKYTNVEDQHLQDLAKEYNNPNGYQNVEVGVYFSDNKQATDPYFKGLGPERQPCTLCAGCMVGCRHNAKNTLDKNYLYFAEKNGASVFCESKVWKIEKTTEGYLLHTKTLGLWGSSKITFTCKGVIVSGGVLGTLELLLQQKYKYKTLPLLSNTLGKNVRTNSEMLCGIVHPSKKLNHNLAITSVFKPDPDTNIEVVKFPSGSNLMIRLGFPAAPNGNIVKRVSYSLWQIIKHPIRFVKTYFSKYLAERTIIFLVMQTLNNSFTLRYKKFPFSYLFLKSEQGENDVPAFIPQGQDAMLRYAKSIGGIAHNAITEMGLNMSTTAHILGGAPMAKDDKDGLIGTDFQVHNYPNMYIIDGSVLQCNPGVNPSLTITALAEYAMSTIAVNEGCIETTLEEKLINKN